MAIIYSYPPNNNILSTDILVCTSTALVGGKPKNQTKSLSIGSLATYIITSPSNNLNQILTNGNTSLLDAKIGELYLYDNPNGDYAKISIQDNLFLVSRANSGTDMFYVDNGAVLSLDNGVGQANILNNLTTTRTYTLPDKSGTIALTSDIPSLQQVINVGNTIVVPTTVTKGIDITLANQTSVFQNGISVTIPTQTGAFPTYSPAPDAFVANINGQTPGTLIGSVVGFLASAANDDNIGFFADLTATSGTSRGFEVSSFDAHTGDYFIARKYVLGADSVVFKVANNGDTTAKSFIKTDGTSDQFLKANGSTSTMPTLQQVTTAGATTTETITITPSVGQDGIVVNAGFGTIGVFSETAGAGTSVYGLNSDTGTGVLGASPEGYGVLGTSSYGYAIHGSAVDGIGVWGACSNEGGAIVADGGDSGLGTGMTVLNGGVNILGTLNPLSGYQLKLSQDSAAKPGSGSWSVFSDSRIKENIIPYTKGLADILLINTVTYDYNGLGGTTKGAKYTGVIAQEMKEIFPETVSTYKAKLNEEDEEKTELYDFNSSDLTFALINAVKELKAEIEILKAK